ncbi:MAG: hypothetical protein LBI82_13045 [Dysgonamonadaceae bacterium]|jgi:hypothetical protein|nr:hypothetical protein [Dysgonamonadaceae bacterium]
MGNGQYGIFVPGTSQLIANGTAGKRITIKGFRNDPGYWSGIELNSNMPGSKLNYCDISDAGKHGDEFILRMYSGYMKDAHLELNNTTFSNSTQYGLYLQDYSGHCNISSSNPASVTFSGCPGRNICSNCRTGSPVEFDVYSSLSESCNLR